ncbi:MAG TPA: SHOCT domain-containing protein [Xanthobacteraceae bacterium]|nr:SHOCT domain-containing protein [Xanthobacteraceae bacterium]
MIRSPNLKVAHQHKDADTIVAKGSHQDVLEERYARGEITRDEYLQKKEDMGR